MDNPKICHISSIHPRYDTRIFYKECVALAKHFKVVFIVADGGPDEKKKQVEIRSISKQTSRLKRFLITPVALFKAAIKENANVYHLHDPDLIPLGFALKICGKKVIMDIHEDYIDEIRENKPWLPHPLRAIISAGFFILNKLISKRFYLIIAEKSYKKRYKKAKWQLTTVLNYPDTGCLEKYNNPERSKNQNRCVYIGAISEDRGIKTIIEAERVLNKGSKKDAAYFFDIIGPIADDDPLRKHESKCLKFHGRKTVEKAYETAKKSKIGLCILAPIKNYLNSEPTKIFEYMNVGLPIIASDFKLHKDLVEKAGCGKCINPSSPNELADAIKEICNDDKSYKRYIKNCETNKKQYSWESEEEKLISLYQKILRGKT